MEVYLEVFIIWMALFGVLENSSKQHLQKWSSIIRIYMQAKRRTREQHLVSGEPLYREDEKKAYVRLRDFFTKLPHGLLNRTDRCCSSNTISIGT